MGENIKVTLNPSGAKGKILLKNFKVFPTGVSDQLRAHEEGHAKIAEDIAKKAGATAIKRAIDKHISGGKIHATAKTARQAQKEAEEKLAKAVEQAQNDAANDLNGMLKAANKAYDDATKNGTQGDQKAEAEKAANDAVKQYEKGNK